VQKFSNQILVLELISSFRKGLEIGRYFYGGFKLGGKAPHAHTDGSIQLLPNISVGFIKSMLRPKIFRPLKQQTEEALDKETWKVVSKKMISSVHAVFQFRSPNYKVAAILPYFDHCGRYYAV